VAEEACRGQNAGLFLRSLAAWYLARSASRWEQPQKLNVAVSRARPGFTELGEMGWLAACDWIAESVHNSRVDFQKSLSNLQTAATELQKAKMDLFYHQCLLSIAWFENILDLYDEAKAHLDLCENYFIEHDLKVDLGNCYRTRARICTKMGDFVKASEFAQQAEALIKSIGCLPDLGRIFVAEGELALYSTTDFEQTEELFRKAKDLYQSCDLEIPYAYALINQTMLYLQVGKFSQARLLAKKAQKISTKFNLPILLGDCLTLLGLIEQEQGNLAKSIHYFQQAYENHLGSHRSVTLGNDLFNLGNAYAKAGRYQQALHALERSIDVTEQTKYPSRLGLNEMYLARLWYQLKNYQIALEHLDRAETILKPINQADSMVTIARTRARIYSELGLQDQALQYLNTALKLARQNNVPAQAALTERVLGEFLIDQFSFTDAIEHLHNALTAYTEMNMQLDQAFCLISLAKVSILTRDLNQAEVYLKQAQQLSKEDRQEVKWRVKSKQAEISLLKGNQQKAQNQYREAIQSITALRRNFWQPSLAGLYAVDPHTVFEEAISLAVSQNAVEDALNCIEADKAITLINQISLPGQVRSSKSTPEIDGLKNEIHQIQAQIRASSENDHLLQSAMQIRKLRKDLQAKSKRYEALISQLERKGNANYLPVVTQNFSISRFRSLPRLNAVKIGRRWIIIKSSKKCSCSF
jgi:tetratricopeptide (TPR) repeat protein